MGEIDIVAELRRDNARARAIDLEIYSNALKTYHEASQNIAKNGAICSHPRTGTPIENPYLKVQAQQASILSRMPAIKSDRVMKMLSADE